MSKKKKKIKPKETPRVPLQGAEVKKRPNFILGEREERIQEILHPKKK